MSDLTLCLKYQPVSGIRTGLQCKEHPFPLTGYFAALRKSSGSVVDPIHTLGRLVCTVFQHPINVFFAILGPCQMSGKAAPVIVQPE
ncbi:hypothetical protein [Falsiruegeria litorea]|uniref:Uncharacterized protein n=1 Tax=Falsiruegeria litorea TaxID=1280831 RepID=A0ABS5WUN9_9RHOB|nr:hypothetical protein [Falsiruegeria litorea]MBT3142866.1 hypothetical protein [Falsiruegeria litorea]MBT8167208.1 hypothetical protein [Falsiruegeria litorea]